MTDQEDVFERVVSALQPMFDQHDFRRVERMNALLAPAARHAAFVAGQEAVRLVWEESRGSVCLEALEPEFGGTWGDMLLKFIDLRRATTSQLNDLVRILRDELTIYFGQIDLVENAEGFVPGDRS